MNRAFAGKLKRRLKISLPLLSQQALATIVNQIKPIHGVKKKEEQNTSKAMATVEHDWDLGLATVANYCLAGG